LNHYTYVLQIFSGVIFSVVILSWGYFFRVFFRGLNFRAVLVCAQIPKRQLDCAQIYHSFGNSGTLSQTQYGLRTIYLFSLQYKLSFLKYLYTFFFTLNKLRTFYKSIHRCGQKLYFINICELCLTIVYTININIWIINLLIIMMWLNWLTFNDFLIIFRISHISHKL